MQQVNMHEARAHLARLVERVQAGEAIVITRSGKPVARLVPFERDRAPRRLGAMRGKIWVADDCDALPPDLLSAFAEEL